METEKKIDALLSSTDYANTALAIQLIEHVLSMSLHEYLLQRPLEFQSFKWGDKDDFYLSIAVGKVALYYEFRTTYQPYIGVSKLLKRAFFVVESGQKLYPEMLQVKQNVKDVESSDELKNMVQQDYQKIIPYIIEHLSS